MSELKICTDDFLWTRLASSDKPIVMYGMGNGADKILSVAEKYGVEISDFFASDGFVRGHYFHEKKVLSFSEVKEKYNDFIILLSFATSLPSVLENIYTIAENYEFYAPDVPVYGENQFDLDFINANEKKLKEAYSLLADKRSKEIYQNIINYKVSGKISYLQAAESAKSEVNSLLLPECFSSYADLGAYTGDTVKEMLNDAHNLKEIYALEPDARNFRKLSAFADSVSTSDCKINTYNIGAWSHHDFLSFNASGNRNSSISSNRQAEKLTEVDSLDNILCGKRVDYIKYDVEGSEEQAILGSKETIQKFSPSLLVSLYHRSEDIFKLVLLIHSLNPSYNLYIRRFPYIPAWDLNLYATEKADE